MSNTKVLKAESKVKKLVEKRKDLPRKAPVNQKNCFMLVVGSEWKPGHCLMLVVGSEWKPVCHCLLLVVGSEWKPGCHCLMLVVDSEWKPVCHCFNVSSW